jgi:hypothetical protein
MSRSQESQVFNQGTGNATTDQANAAQSFGTASGAINKQLANPGFDPATKTAITSSGQQANNAAFDSLAQQAQERATRSGNTAGANATTDALAMQKAQGGANAAMKAQTGIGEAALTGEQKATGQMADLYGTSLSGGNNALGTAQRAGMQPSFGDTFGTDFAGALAKGLVPSYSKGGLTV